MSLIPEPKFNTGERVYYTNWAWKYGEQNRTNTALIYAVEYEAKGYIDEDGNNVVASVHYHLNDGTRQHESNLYKNKGDI